MWIVLLGSLLHFTFELSGESKLVALFSVANESIWEHLKLGYFSLLFFMKLEYFFIGNNIKNFFTGKFVGITSMSIFIIIIFYSYEAITGSHNLIVDIGSFVIGALICQVISYNITKISISLLDSLRLMMLRLYDFYILSITYTIIYGFKRILWYKMIIFLELSCVSNYNIQMNCND